MCISSAVKNGKYMNYWYNSEQMFIVCSNRIKIKCNWLLETSCFNVHQKIRKNWWSGNNFSGKICKSWRMGIAKVDIDVVNLPPKTKNNEKLDS